MASPTEAPPRIHNPLQKYEGVRHKDLVAERYLTKVGVKFKEIDEISQFTRSNYSRESFFARFLTYVRPKPVKFEPSNLWRRAQDITSRRIFRSFDPATRTRFTDLDQIPYIQGSAAGPGYPHQSKLEAYPAALEAARNIMSKYPEPSSIPEEFFHQAVISVFPRSAPSTVDSPKSRPIFANIFQFILLESVIAIPLYNHFKSLASLSNPPVFYGQTLSSLKGLISSYAPHFDKETNITHPVTEVDYSRFDRLVCSAEQTFALDSYFQCIKDPSKLETYAYGFIKRRNAAVIAFQFEDVIYHTYDISISGRILTTMTSTITNFLRQTYLHLYIEEKFNLGQTPFRLTCLGDDSIAKGLTAEKLSSALATEAFSKVFKNDTPVIKVMQHFSYNTVTFLGHSVSGRSIYRQQEEIISLLLFPEKPLQCSDNTALSYLRIQGLDQDSGHQHLLLSRVLKLIRQEHPTIDERALAVQQVYETQHRRPLFILSQ